MNLYHILSIPTCTQAHTYTHIYLYITRLKQPFFSTRYNLRDKFVRFWGKVATEFSASKYMLGYELINEPWAGDIIKEPDLLIPGIADRKYLQPMYDDINLAVRAVDTEHLILFQVRRRV